MSMSDTPEQIAKWKHERTLKLRQEYVKKAYSPFKTESVFDPAVARIMALKVSQYEYFKPNFKTWIRGWGVTFIPMILFGYVMWKERKTKEELYRTGQVAYKDRLFKFI